MKKRICLAVITFLIITGSYTAVQAIISSDLEQRRAELKIQIEEVGKNLESINVELTENLEAINKLDEEIYEYEEQIKVVSENLVQIEKQINETENHLKTVQTRYNHQEELLQKRLVYAYEAGPTRYLDVLLNSKNIVDFITNYYLIAEVTEYDKNLLDGIKEERNQITKIEEELNLSKEKLKEIKLEQKKIVISLENSKVVRTSYINKLTAEELKIKEELNIYQEELDLVELEILLTALENTDSRYVGGIFAWPAPGYYTITSPYGMRNHPILKTYRKHTGMDIGAPTGSYAIAANAGIVTKSTYSYSYGNMIMIDHGGGVTTLYAHGSKLIAQVGDIVQRGEVVMEIGSTGWSTGPHLHFEIRINGQTVDPYPYVTTSIETNSEE